MFERDYIKRFIQQIAEFTARVWNARDEGRYDEALDDIQDAYEKLVPTSHDLVTRVDVASAARLMRDREVVKAYAQLMVEEAEIWWRMGEQVRARTRRVRALGLFEQVVKMSVSPDADVEAGMKTLKERLQEDA